MELSQVSTQTPVIDDLRVNAPIITLVIKNARNRATGVATDYGFTYGGAKCYTRLSPAEGEPYTAWQYVESDENMKTLYAQYVEWVE